MPLRDSSHRTSPMTLPRRTGYHCGLDPGPLDRDAIRRLIDKPLDGWSSSQAVRPEAQRYLTQLVDRYHEVCNDLQARAGDVPISAVATCIVRIRRRFAELFQLMLAEVLLHDAPPSPPAQPLSTSGAGNVMKRWFLANLSHPYPTNQQKEELAREAGLTFNQVNNWFVNVRMRVWRPLVKNFGYDIRSRQEGIFPMTRTQESLPPDIVNEIIQELQKVD